jgi:hypothetical protein
MALDPSTLVGMGENINIIYKSTPFYLTWTFAVAIILFLAVVSLALYAHFRISLRNRLNVIIHMPDKTRKMLSYKKYAGDNFNIMGNELDKDGKPISQVYFFRADALEQGFFGRYIEYDYGISEPRRARSDTKLSLDFKFIASLLNTQLVVDLLLSQKWKDLVTMLLIIILIACFINMVGVGITLFTHDTSIRSCSLAFTNETFDTWQKLVSTTATN